jgi:hypothetical protein
MLNQLTSNGALSFSCPISTACSIRYSCADHRRDLVVCDRRRPVSTGINRFLQLVLGGRLADQIGMLVGARGWRMAYTVSEVKGSRNGCLWL